MIGRFIAHAGIYIEDGDASLLIDPWFTDSTKERPYITSVFGHATIDFQIPQAVDTSHSFNPDTVLLSHFHTHHAPSDDVYALAAHAQKETIIAHPAITKNMEVKEKFSPFNFITTRPVNDQETFQVGQIKVTGLNHPVEEHIAWLIEGPTGRILHIADSAMNSRPHDKTYGKEWIKFFDLEPDWLFLSVGGNNLRKQRNGVPYIIESSILSPVEAAHIVQRIRPRAATVIGCYNHSIWRNRKEYIRPASIIEDEFYWASSWVAPTTRCVFMKPGDVFAVGVKECSEDIHYYL